MIQQHIIAHQLTPQKKADKPLLGRSNLSVAYLFILTDIYRYSTWNEPCRVYEMTDAGGFHFLTHLHPPKFNVWVCLRIEKILVLLAYFKFLAQQFNLINNSKKNPKIKTN